MKCTFALASAAMLATPASTPPLTGPGTAHFAGWPPDEYIREFATVAVFVESTERYCGPPPPAGLVRYGCAFVRDDGTPVMIVLHPVYWPHEEFSRIIAHEGAHLAGWGVDHPMPADPAT